MKKLIILFICLLFCLQTDAAQLKFAQVTDVHFSSSGTRQRNNSRDVSKTRQVLEWAVRSLNLKNPKFVVFMGDNIDKSNEDDIIEFLGITKSLKMPYYLAFGNHDAYENGGVKKEDFWKIVRKYNKNNKSKVGYYSFSPNSHFLCIVLDGAVPYSPTAHGIYSDEQLKWLDKTLKRNKHKKVMIFQHFPLIDPDENPTHSMLYKEKYEEVINKHNNIISISSGHFHTKKITVDERGIYHIASPALVTPDYVYDLITIDYTIRPLLPVKINEIKVTPIDLQ